MSYQATADMIGSNSLRMRIVACAAQEGVVNPDQWVAEHLWQIVTQPGWGDDWAYAQDNLNVNQNPDIGARTDVCSDAMILGAVQAVKALP